jgi:hypothetical protein
VDVHAAAVGRLADGTRYVAPIEEIVRDYEEDRVQCHLRGVRWSSQALAQSRTVSEHRA